MPPAAARAARRGPYSVHPGVEMMQRWVATLNAKSGRSLEEWVSLVRKSGPASEDAQREWLKARHGLGTNAAWWIVDRVHGRGEEDVNPQAYLAAAEGWVAAMYSGKRESLRPIHDQLIEAAQALGSDVRICPCKTIVPFYRKHVFAEIKPATNSRVDFGLALGAMKTPSRVESLGARAKGNRITHRIALAAAGEVDDEVLGWLRRAYDLNQ